MVKPFDAISRRWKYRHEFSSLRDWLVTYYDAVVRHFRDWPFPLRDKLVGLSLKVSDRPFFVRLGRTDAYVLEEVFLRSMYGAKVEQRLGDIRQIVDLGGNIGMTVRLWQLRFPEARILVVEPSDDNCEVLQKNIEGSLNVTLVQACIGATDRQAYLDTRNRPDGQFRMTDQADEHAHSVPVKTMVHLLEEFGIAGEIDLLKCDIEGSERELFSDCREWIGRVRNLTIEVHGDYTKDRLLEDLRRNGADMVVTEKNEGEYVLMLQRRG